MACTDLEPFLRQENTGKKSSSKKVISEMYDCFCMFYGENITFVLFLMTDMLTFTRSQPSLMIFYLSNTFHARGSNSYPLAKIVQI